jgi:hypothetical protein
MFQDLLIALTQCLDSRGLVAPNEGQEKESGTDKQKLLLAMTELFHEIRPQLAIFLTMDRL